MTSSGKNSSGKADRYADLRAAYEEYSASAVEAAKPRETCTEPRCNHVAVSWDGNKDGWCRRHSNVSNRGELGPEIPVKRSHTDELMRQHMKSFERRSGESAEQYRLRMRKEIKRMSGRVFQSMP